MPKLPPIPPAFAAKKEVILASLALPSSDYKDLSPKGTVDEAIIPLITKINQLQGVVTTSSCAGRVSIFLEGEKGHDGGNFEEDESNEGEGEGVQESDGKGVPGGKGRGGRWLFVSHEPVDVRQATVPGGSASSVFGIMRQFEQSSDSHGSSLREVGMRHVRFQFEPMILHIMTASLAHASSILAAAINAGFRESGVQSLKNLDDPLNAFPMVAVRTSGLSFESLIGYVVENALDRNAEENVQSLVSRNHLQLLLEIANRRFEANHQRMQRFQTELFRRYQEGVEWEQKTSRQARKRAEGLERRDMLRDKINDDETTAVASSINNLEEEPAEDILGSLLLIP